MVIALLASAAALQAELPAKPNILFILTDDQGYGDLSAHGNPVLKTPNLDKLHSQSVRFTDFNVSPTCSPTRSVLHSGRHEFRNGVTHTILERERMRLDTVTITQLLQQAGYTTGIFGKWHLGDEPDYQPGRRGYDEVFIHGAGGIGQSYPGSCGDAPGNTYFNPAILHNGTFVKTTGYCTDVFFAQATRWIESVKGKKPFYCYIPTNAPHGPYIARPEDKALYEGKVPEPADSFYGMLHNIDQNVGALLAKLEQWGIAGNTLVIFMNDNGGTAGVKHFNAGMRTGKGTPYHGGGRAISFWRWPGVLQPADCDRLTAHLDFYRTIARIGGATLTPQADRQAEGLDLVPLLLDPKAAWPERFLVRHVGRWNKGSPPEKYSNCSIRHGDHLLVSPGKNDSPKWELYDLKADPGEKNNIASAHPRIVGKLSAHYDQWWDSVQKDLVNEHAELAPANPFREIYLKQFGELPPGTKNPGEPDKPKAKAKKKPK
jgi:arylsulfatase